MKSQSIFISFIMIALYATLGDKLCEPFGLSRDSEFYHRFTYMFAHGSWLHLLINIYSLFIIFFIANGNWWQSLYSLAVSVYLPYCIIPGDKLLIGASTFIYCMTGVLIMNSKKYLELITVNIFISLFPLLLPQSNIAAIPHLYCLFCGLLFGVLTARIHG